MIKSLSLLAAFIVCAAPLLPSAWAAGPYEGRFALQDKGVAQGSIIYTPSGECYVRGRTVRAQASVRGRAVPAPGQYQNTL